jgi:hypothetical protein
MSNMLVSKGVHIANKTHGCRPIVIKGAKYKKEERKGANVNEKRRKRKNKWTSERQAGYAR